MSVATYSNVLGLKLGHPDFGHACSQRNGFLGVAFVRREFVDWYVVICLYNSYLSRVVACASRSYLSPDGCASINLP